MSSTTRSPRVSSAARNAPPAATSGSWWWSPTNTTLAPTVVAWSMTAATSRVPAIAASSIDDDGGGGDGPLFDAVAGDRRRVDPGAVLQLACGAGGRGETDHVPSRVFVDARGGCRGCGSCRSRPVRPSPPPDRPRVVSTRIAVAWSSPSVDASIAASTAYRVEYDRHPPALRRRVGREAAARRRAASATCSAAHGRQPTVRSGAWTGRRSRQ